MFSGPVNISKKKRQSLHTECILNSLNRPFDRVLFLTRCECSNDKKPTRSYDIACSDGLTSLVLTGVVDHLKLVSVKHSITVARIKKTYRISKNVVKNQISFSNLKIFLFVLIIWMRKTNLVRKGLISEELMTCRQRALGRVDVKRNHPHRPGPVVRRKSQAGKQQSGGDIMCSCCSFFISSSEESAVLFDIRPTCSSDRAQEPSRVCWRAPADCLFSFV